MAVGDCRRTVLGFPVSQALSAKDEFLRVQYRVERDVGRFARRSVDFLHRPADTDAQRAGMRSEIAVIMTAALADAAAPAIEPDERAENDRSEETRLNSSH